MSTAFRILATRFGHMAFVVLGRGLRRVYLPQRGRAALRRKIGREFSGAAEDAALWPEFATTLRRYFDGEPVKFAVPVHWEQGSDFHVAVWKACRKVRHGQTVSYGQLAERVGQPGVARAVGSAMRRNLLPIVVPCHRVLKSDGSLGGFSAEAGTALKARLLKMEAAARPS